MTKRLVSIALGFVFILTLRASAGAPLLLDWGPVDTSSATAQAKSKAIRTSKATTVQRLSTRGTAPWLVQFNDVIREEWKAELTAAGAEIRGYMPENGFVVLATPEQITTIGSLPDVDYVGEFLPEYKRSKQVRKMVAKGGEETLEYNVWTYRPEDAEDIASDVAALTGTQVTHTEALPDRGLVRAILPVSAVETVTDWGAVEWVDPYMKPQLWNEVATKTSLMNVSNAWSVLGLSGAGQTLAVCDTGLDTGNTGTIQKDFTNRVTGFGWSNGVYSSGYSWADYDSHGTHVSGSVMGNGTMSTGKYRGVAFEANLIFQGAQEDLSGIPANLTTLFKQAFDNGARIHSDSWGYDDDGYYNADSRYLDMFTWSNQTMLVLIAAGNQGIDSDSDGVVDLDSIGSPGTAKNCLTVGAAESDRPEFSSYTWGSSWADDYPAEPIYSDEISGPADGTNQGMAAFSSRGPCDDGRIKPDIVAPGTDIISTRSRSSTNVGWGVVSANTNYLWMGGTSMATPLTAGAAGLTREWITTTGGVTNPIGALVKALLINGARNMSPGQYGTGSYQEISATRPDNVQGWGHVDLYDTLAPATNQFLDLIDTNSLSTGQTNTFTYAVTSASTNPFIVTLAYADYWGTVGSGKQLINDLDVTVTKPLGTTLYANGRTSKDATNNVEMIEFEADETGTYTVAVSARTVPSGGSQPYALVVRGPAADETPVAPEFGANPGPVGAMSGVVTNFTVTASGYPIPVLALESTTATVDSYLFDEASGYCIYEPPAADIGTNTFTFTATNTEGAVTQIVTVVVSQGPPEAPASIWASATNATDFTAAWSSSTGATSYRLDVATNATFSGGGSGGGTLIDEDFTDFSDWTDSGTTSDTSHFGDSSPCRALGTGDSLTSPAVDYPTQMTFYVDSSSGGSGYETTNYYSLDGGSTWLPIGAFTVDSAGATETQDLTSSPDLSGETNVMFRFVSAFYTWYLDDVVVTGGSVGEPSYVPGYSNRTVAGTSQSVTGLTAGATYYFRSRAVNTAGTSSNSPVGSVTTLETFSAPEFSANPGPVATTAGVEAAFTVSAGGVPTPTLALQSQTASSGYSFTPATGELTYTPPQADAGAQTFTFSATNSQGTTSQVVTVNVTAATAPAFTGGAGPYSTTAGVEVTFTVSASGTPAATLALESTTASSGYSFTPASGAFTYTPPEADVGTPTFTFIAANVAGTVTQVTSVSVAAAPTAPDAPASVWAGATNTTDFTAAWSASTGAESYRLDVATNATFTGGGGDSETLISEDFTDFSDWSDSGTASDTSHYGDSSPCRALGTGDSLTSPAVDYPTQMTFYVDSSSGGNGITTTNYYSLDGGMTWLPIGTFTVTTDGTTETQDLTSSPDLSGETNVMFRFVSAFYTWYLDDVEVTGGSAAAPSYVPGYQDRTVAGTSQSVTGLTAETAYYFRVRAVNAVGTSGDSSTAGVTTLSEALSDQTITFPAIGDKVTTDTVGLSATASSGLEVTFAVGSGPASLSGGTNLSFTGAGSVSIVASQVGDSSWNPAPDVTNTFTVSKALASVTLSDLSQMVDGSAKSATVTTDPAGLTVNTTYDGSSNAPSAVGTYEVIAIVSDSIYAGGATGTFEIVTVTNVFENWVTDQGESPSDPDFYPDEDIDGDGATTWEEFLADTDPAAADSCLVLTGAYAIASVSNDNGSMVLTFPASPNRYYQLEYCTSLTDHLVGTTDLGWGQSGMAVTNSSTGTWYGVIRVFLQEP